MAILDSDTLLSSLTFIQSQSHSTLTLTQTNSIWLKLMSFWLNLMMAAIYEFCHLGFNHLIFSQTEPIFALRRQAFTWTLSRLHLVWGKCFPNFIIAKMLYGKMCVPQFWTPIFMICCIILDCGKDFIIATCMWFGIFDRISPIEVVSRCYC